MPEADMQKAGMQKHMLEMLMQQRVMLLIPTMMAVQVLMLQRQLLQMLAVVQLLIQVLLRKQEAVRFMLPTL